MVAAGRVSAVKAMAAEGGETLGSAWSILLIRHKALIMTGNYFTITTFYYWKHQNDFLRLKNQEQLTGGLAFVCLLAHPSFLHHHSLQVKPGRLPLTGFLPERSDCKSGWFCCAVKKMFCSMWCVVLGLASALEWWQMKLCLRQTFYFLRRVSWYLFHLGKVRVKKYQTVLEKGEKYLRPATSDSNRSIRSNFFPLIVDK